MIPLSSILGKDEIEYGFEKVIQCTKIRIKIPF